MHVMFVLNASKIGKMGDKKKRKKKKKDDQINYNNFIVDV